MKSTQFSVEDVFGDNLGEEGITSEQVTKFKKFSAKMMQPLILS